MEGNQDGTSNASVQSEHVLHEQNVPIEFTSMNVQIKSEIDVCVVGWPWLDTRCPSSCSIAPLSQLGRGEKIDGKQLLD